MLRKNIVRVNGKRNVPSLPEKAAVKEARFTLQTPSKSESKSKNGGAHPPNGGLQPPQPAPQIVAGTPEVVTIDSPVIAEKIKDLLRLAQDQGYVTYDDINDAIPDEVVSPELLDTIYSKLRGFEVEIVEAPDLERPKAPEPEEEVEESRLDILDDPVQMYLRQMGKVPLLTREQEVEICKRIEEGETEARRILFGFGFTGKEHIALAEKLLADPPR